MKKIWAKYSLYVVFFFLVGSLSSCAKKQFKPMKVGETVLLKPIPNAAPSTNFQEVHKNYFIMFNEGGKFSPLDSNDDDITFFAKPTDKDPVAKYTAKELGHMAEKTNCSKEILQFAAENPIKGALFCNGTFDPNKIGYYTLFEKDENEFSTCTQAFVDSQNNALDLVSLVVGFH